MQSPYAKKQTKTELKASSVIRVLLRLYVVEKVFSACKDTDTMNWETPAMAELP